jgi:hypothetical protein
MRVMDIGVASWVYAIYIDFVLILAITNTDYVPVCADTVGNLHTTNLHFVLWYLWENSCNRMNCIYVACWESQMGQHMDTEVGKHQGIYVAC